MGSSFLYIFFSVYHLFSSVTHKLEKLRITEGNLETNTFKGIETVE